MLDWIQKHPLLPDVINILQQKKIEAYLVGGAVRDLLLGRQHIVDLDFAVAGDGLAAARHTANALKAAYYPLDVTRGTGRVVHGTPPARVYLDFAALRGPTLLADLQDRDFSINAIAWQVSPKFQLIDPLHGQQDLERRQINVASPHSLQNDPIRVLRGVRQAIQFNFDLPPHTRQLMRQAANGLPQISPERQRDELIKLMNTPAPGKALTILRQLAVLPHILPEAAAMSTVEQSAPHYLDVFDHTAAALDGWAKMLQQELPNVSPDFREAVQKYLGENLAGQMTPAKLMPLALLFHDTGKPHTRTVEGDRIRFFGHEEVSEQIARQSMERLHFSNQAINFVGKTVRHHMRPILLAADTRHPSRRAIFRFFRDTSNAGAAVALHALADQQAIYRPGTGQVEWQALQQVVNRLLTACFAEQQQVVAPPPLLTGRDLIDTFDLCQGRIIGTLLNRLTEAQAAGDVSTKTEALAFVAQEIGNERLEIG